MDLPLLASKDQRTRMASNMHKIAQQVTALLNAGVPAKTSVVGASQGAGIAIYVSISSGTET